MSHNMAVVESERNKDWDHQHEDKGVKMLKQENRWHKLFMAQHETKKKTFSVSCSLVFLWSHLKSRRWACRTIRGMLYITFHWGHNGNSCTDPWGNVLGNIQRDVWQSKGDGDGSGHDGRASGAIHVFLLTVSDPSVAAHSPKSTENSWIFHSLRWGSVLWNQSSSICSSTSLTLLLHFQRSWKGCGGGGEVISLWMNLQSFRGFFRWCPGLSPASLSDLNVVKEQQFPVANLTYLHWCIFLQTGHYNKMSYL